MAKFRKRTEVTIESETLLIVRRGGGALRAWCGPCGAETLMLTPREAAMLAGVTTRLIYARAEAGALHFQELPDGTLLICGHSVAPKKT
jgi:hypothetical protein